MNPLRELKDIANNATKLVQDEIKRQGLVKSGKLLNSIKFEVEHQGGLTYSLKMEAVEYFSSVDKKHGILKNVLQSRGWERIQERLTHVYNLLLTEEIARDFRSK